VSARRTGVGPPPGRRRVGALVVWLLLAAVAVGGVLVVHGAMPGWYARMWYPLEHEEAIRTEAARSDLPPELVAAVIYAESGFVPDSRSPKGAVGLMQVLPSTATWMASRPTRPSPAPGDLEDPAVNIAYGAHLLGEHRREFGSVPAALVAYNAGHEALRSWRRDARARGGTLRIPQDVPYPETRAYVGRVLEMEAIYRRAYGGELRSPG